MSNEEVAKQVAKLIELTPHANEVLAEVARYQAIDSAFGAFVAIIIMAVVGIAAYANIKSAGKWANIWFVVWVVTFYLLAFAVCWYLSIVIAPKGYILQQLINRAAG